MRLRDPLFFELAGDDFFDLVFEAERSLGDFFGGDGRGNELAVMSGEDCSGVNEELRG